MLPREGQVKGVHYHQALTYYMKCSRDLSKKKKIKNMNSKMTTNSQLSPTEPKKTKTKQTTTIGTESQKWRSQGRLSAGKGRGKMGEKVQGISSINGRYKIDRGRLRIVWETGKPKNSYV